MNDVVIAGAGPNGLMLACELGLAGLRPIVVDPLPGPNPQPRANGVTGQGVRSSTIEVSTASCWEAEPPHPSPWAMFAAFALDLAGVADRQAFMLPSNSHGLCESLLSGPPSMTWTFAGATD